jgi:methylenetetrahydrofolate--tRNA-(uracil-5-)-methyltransferase
MTGVEGYIESAATGLLAGINAARLLADQQPAVPPATTALGALLRYITDPERERFQPMNVNFGLLPPLPLPLRGKAKKEAMARRALADMAAWARDAEGAGHPFESRPAIGAETVAAR